MSPTFTCHMCAQVYDTVDGWTDVDAFNEAVDHFGVVAFEDNMLPTCDNCYAEFMVWAKEKGLV